MLSGLSSQMSGASVQSQFESLVVLCSRQRCHIGTRVGLSEFTSPSTLSLMAANKLFDLILRFTPGKGFILQVGSYSRLTRQ